jgi:ATP-dependent helicase/nuclease subunit B
MESLPTAVIEADEIARYFRAVKDDEALPALVVCDAEMHSELEGAFQNHFSEEELVLRNPSGERLSKSSLGRLLGAIVRLGAERDYESFSTLIRMGDVARWAAGALSATPGEVARFTGALDAVQNAHLPRTIDEAIAGAAAEAAEAWSAEERRDAAGLKRFAEAVKSEIGDPMGFLKKIFASLTLDEKRPGDRELAAAAQTVRDIRDACGSGLIPAQYRNRIFARLLKSASYMLEPTAENVLATAGWLEVPWCLEDEIVIAGFNEGCVPENIVGHPFVPDALRKELSLRTNAGREARDSFILSQAVACRESGAVTVYLHQIAGDKNVMKPSRLLFNGISDRDLPALALRLYAVTKGGEGAPAKELPPAWRLRLPFPPAGTVYRERMTPTALDQYLRCPFNFYLQEVFGSHADDRNQELDAMAFGNLCHSALDVFAKEGPKDSVDPEEIAAFLEGEVRRSLRAFGVNPPAIIELQGEAAIERLKVFSALQAERRRAGWRIVCSERNFTCRIKDCPTLLSGKVDRIDRHETTGELAIIDYKTWNCAKKENYDSVQLPIYRAMVEASGEFGEGEARRSKAFYCVLAERPEDTMFDEAHAFHEGSQSEAEDAVAALLTGIAKGIFYPPGKESGWKRDYGSLIWESPEEGIDPLWLEDQKSRLAAEASACAPAGGGEGNAESGGDV